MTSIVAKPTTSPSVITWSDLFKSYESTRNSNTPDLCSALNNSAPLQIQDVNKNPHDTLLHLARKCRLFMQCMSTTTTLKRFMPTTIKYALKQNAQDLLKPLTQGYFEEHVQPKLTAYPSKRKSVQAACRQLSTSYSVEHCNQLRSALRSTEDSELLQDLDAIDTMCGTVWQVSRSVLDYLWTSVESVPEEEAIDFEQYCASEVMFRLLNTKDAVFRNIALEHTNTPEPPMMTELRRYSLLPNDPLLMYKSANDDKEVIRLFLEKKSLLSFAEVRAAYAALVELSEHHEGADDWKTEWNDLLEASSAPLSRKRRLRCLIDAVDFAYQLPHVLNTQDDVHAYWRDVYNTEDTLSSVLDQLHQYPWFPEPLEGSDWQKKMRFTDSSSVDILFHFDTAFRTAVLNDVMVMQEEEEEEEDEEEEDDQEEEDIVEESEEECIESVTPCHAPVVDVPVATSDKVVPKRRRAKVSV